MRRVRRKLLNSPITGRLIRLPFRLTKAIGPCLRQLGAIWRWLIVSRETTNFTYNLQAQNVAYLASQLADILGIPYDQVMGYMQELEGDEELRRHIAATLSNSEFAVTADKEARYGRRLGWYAVARAIKPQTIVETGVDKGLGACVLTAALKRNAAEGFAGEYIGTDINPRAGFLLAGEYAAFGRVVYGDSLAALQAFAGTIDLFINDSDHASAYEAAEYEAIREKLAPDAILLGDNAHATTRLLAFAHQTGRHFVYFHERPRDHWYPGAGIGICFRRGAQ